MAERAAHPVDHVSPDVPVRQWVFSLPSRLRYRLAWDHDLCRAVVAVGMLLDAWQEDLVLLRHAPPPEPDDDDESEQEPGEQARTVVN
jgi:hypothetical protein